MNQILFGMVSCGVLSEVSVKEERGPAYQPGLDPRRMSVKFVIDVIDQHGSADISMARSEELERIVKTLALFSEMIETSPTNKPLGTLYGLGKRLSEESHETTDILLLSIKGGHPSHL